MTIPKSAHKEIEEKAKKVLVFQDVVNLGKFGYQLAQKELEECRAAHDFHVKLNKELQALVKQFTPEYEKCREKLAVAKEALNELFIPYSAKGPGSQMPRFPDTIIREALSKINGEIKEGEK